MAVYEVNETFVDFLAVRNEIDETFPSFYNDSMRYLSAAAFGTLKKLNKSLIRVLVQILLGNLCMEMDYF